MKKDLVLEFLEQKIFKRITEEEQTKKRIKDNQNYEAWKEEQQEEQTARKASGEEK